MQPKPQSGYAPRVLVAATLGGLSVLSFAPLAWFWLLPCLCLGLFLLLRDAESPRHAFGLAWAYGLLFLGLGVSWVYVSLSVFGQMPEWIAAPATLLFCAVLALFPACAGWLFRRWRPLAPWRQMLWFALLFAWADWARGYVLTGFPWLAWGYTQTPPSPLAGFAPLVGVYGLSFLVALTGALLSARTWGLLFVIVVAISGHLLRQYEWTKADGPPITVALIQGNVSPEFKWQSSHILHSLVHYRDFMARYPAQLTVLPETALPIAWSALPAEYLDQLRQLAMRQHGDVIVGVVTGERGRYFNSAVSLGTSPSQTYSKRHLVPFGEFIPPGFAWFVSLAGLPMSDFARGETAAPLSVAGRKVAVNICYEDVFGEELIDALPEAGLLVNLSNTAWFGDSLAQPQHFQMAQMRALETGRPVLRATNTGVTGAIAHNGRVLASLPSFVEGGLTVAVTARQGMTPYARLGNSLFGVLSLFLLLVIGGQAAWDKARAASSGPRESQ